MSIKSLVKGSLLALFLFLSASTAFAQEKIIVSVFLNGESKGEAFVYLTSDKDILLTDSDMKELNLKLKGKETVVDGHTHVSLRSLQPGVKFEFKERELAVNIEAPPEVFEKSSIDLYSRPPSAVTYPKQNSAFLNYSLDLIMAEGGGSNIFNLPFEVGVKHGEYLFSSQFSYTKSKEEEKLLRLFTNVIRDDNTSLRRYTAGDVSAGTGELGGSATLGGFGVSKNFSMNPYFLKYPGINLSGLLTSTSDVELWSDGILVSRQRLSPGQFEFQNIPATTGTGEAMLVIRDAFGREQRILLPFYFSSSVLKKGLHEYSYNIGFVREDVGVKNFNYTNPAALMFHRYGFTEKFTAGVRAEANKDLASAGVSANYVQEGIGFFDASLAYSTSKGKSGEAYSLGYSNALKKTGIFWRINLRRYSEDYTNISIATEANRPTTEIASIVNYTNLSSTPVVTRPKSEISSSLGYNNKKFGSFSFLYSYTEDILNAKTNRFSVRYTKGIAKDLNLDISASHTRTDTSVREILVTLRYTFDKTTSLNTTYQSVDGASGGNFNLQKSAENERGFAYNIFAEKKQETSSSYDTELDYYGRYGVYTGRFRRAGDVNSYELKTSGSIVTSNGSVHFGQPVTDSFAIVKLGNLQGIDVYNNQTPVYKTDSSGETLITRLPSYNTNKIMVRDKDLPMSYTLKSFEQFISPSYRSGSYIVFEVEKIQAISGNILILEKGVKKPAEFWQLSVDTKPVSTGSPVVNGGEFYLENIPAGSYPAVIKKGDKKCSFTLVIPDSLEPSLNLTDITCEMK